MNSTPCERSVATTAGSLAAAAGLAALLAGAGALVVCAQATGANAMKDNNSNIERDRIIVYLFQ